MGSVRRHLSDYLWKCNHYELMLERIREKIAENPYYQVQTVFERMDKFKKGYLVPDDLSEFMLQNKIYPTEIELYLIFRDFDKQRAGVITLSHLSSQLLPKQNKKIYQKAVDRRYYPAEIRLQIDLEFAISKYFEHKIKQIKDLSCLRIQMFRKQAYSVEEAFGLLDYEKRGFLSKPVEIDQFMRSNAKVMTQDELNRIFRVLSFDLGSQITYQTFSEHLDPLGKGYYIGYSQRVAEKQLIHQGYLRRKLELNEQIARNSIEKAVLANTIGKIQESNLRLSGMIEWQERELQLQAEQLLACRIRRNYL